MERECGQMDKEKIARINYLAKKSRESGLTDSEKIEQTMLRNEYRASVVGNLKSQLDKVEFREPDGSITKPKPRQ
jgi:hypothetical protein rflaF_17377